MMARFLLVVLICAVTGVRVDLVLQAHDAAVSGTRVRGEYPQ